MGSVKSANTQMPTFFVIGAPKGGTTSLHAYLDLHPEISMSRSKEPMFFLPEEIRSDWPLDDLSKTKVDYLALFDGSKPERGESSTAYSRYPMVRGVPEAIHAEVPDAKLIYSVRDPLERIPSAWIQLQQARKSSNRRRNRVASLQEMIEPFDDPDNHLVWPGMYMTQIRQYLQYFPKESILVIESEELMTGRDAVMREVFTFLDVEPEFRSPGFAEERNTVAAKTIERDLYVRLTNSRPLRMLVERLPEFARDRTIEFVRSPLSRPAEKPVIDAGLRRRLEDHFRPEVEELRTFTGKAFSAWSI